MRENHSSIKVRISKEHILAVCIGLVYVWFGSLKFFSATSPAEELAVHTLAKLTNNLVPSYLAIFILALWETMIGILLIAQKYNRSVIIMALIHIVGTFSPLILFPEMTFNENVFLPTLLGQYIVKNIIIIGALYSLLNTNKPTHFKTSKHTHAKL